ncbi:hypothetical protein [Heterosigma akashiwo virus 01]|uniref:Uncharacterized protein n=1 Tax=Heterosigma akashiwo virus 01 TaxID=97195 RepID=A0A1C9C546_HAV01|nr:hypothetical protein D1R72_gp072 [Heterosigma akashiwo virus 01]AOM63403.1 hypothetical protein [Heterosigma akashiwo virus 01]
MNNLNDEKDIIISRPIEPFSENYPHYIENEKYRISPLIKKVYIRDKFILCRNIIISILILILTVFLITTSIKINQDMKLRYISLFFNTLYIFISIYIGYTINQPLLFPVIIVVIPTISILTTISSLSSDNLIKVQLGKMMRFYPSNNAMQQTTAL